MSTPTEPASPRRLARARARGDVPFTADWPLAAALLAGLALLGTSGAAWLSAWTQLARDAFSLQLSAAHAAQCLHDLGTGLAALVVLPLMAAGVVLALQRAPGLRTLNAADADPRAPRRRPPPYTRGQQACVTLLKWLVLSLALGSLLWDSLPGLLDAHARSAQTLWSLALHALRGVAWRAIWTLLLLGGLDLALQQALRLRRLRMTRREVMDEQRELAGDPFILSERRARSLAGPELLTPQLYAAKLAQLSAAALVLTGEGRAVALHYAPERMTAPVLWLKAEGSQALELVARAYAVGVPLASDNLLAEELYRLEPMQPIPAAMHARVAQLMAAEAHS